jgi:hypothetical protein
MIARTTYLALVVVYATSAYAPKMHDCQWFMAKIRPIRDERGGIRHALLGPYFKYKKQKKEWSSHFV